MSVAKMRHDLEPNRIFDLYHDRIRRFVVMTVKDEWVADDLTQNVFVRAFNRLDTLKDSSKLSSWLFRIAYNQCLDYFRASGKQNEQDVEMDETRQPSNHLPVEKELERREMSLCIQNQVMTMSETYRTVVWLFDVLGFSLNETAGILGISLENAKIRLHRARRKLKTILEENCRFERDERNVFVCMPRQKGRDNSRQ